MENLNVPKSVRSIVVTKTEPSGERSTRVLLDKRSKRKKQSEILRPFERLARSLVRARITGAESYLALHNKSNRKKKNGWARNLLRNAIRAKRKGLRKIF